MTPLTRKHHRSVSWLNTGMQTIIEQQQQCQVVKLIKIRAAGRASGCLGTTQTRTAIQVEWDRYSCVQVDSLRDRYSCVQVDSLRDRYSCVQLDPLRDRCSCVQVDPLRQLHCVATELLGNDLNSFLTAPGKYRLHSMASLVTVSVHASAMSKLQKEMYPSLRQL